MILTVRGIRYQHIESWVHTWSFPNVVAILFLVVHISKTKTFQVFNHCAVTEVRIIDSEGMGYVLLQRTEQREYVFIGNLWRLAMIILIYIVRKYRSFIFRHCNESVSFPENY